MPLPAGYPAYGVPPAQPRPRFADQVLGMRAVVAVALACLIIGGLSGFILGHAAGSDDQRFGRSPGGFFQQRAFPNGQNGFPNGSNGKSQPAVRSGPERRLIHAPGLGSPPWSGTCELSPRGVKSHSR